MRDDAYRLAARAAAAKRERGEVLDAEPVKYEVTLPPSELYERPTGLRRFVFGVRRKKTVNSRLRELV